MRHSKYFNKKTEVNGIIFHSKKEAYRYLDLLTLQQAGVISDLKLQPKFPLIVNGVTVCKYIADFEYLENGELVVEDVKGKKTETYRLKKKIFEALYPMKILET